MTSFLIHTLRFLSRKAAQTSRPHLLTASVATTTAAALAMAMYTPSVVRGDAPAGPDDAKSHHVKGWFGKTTKFRNPHPSAGEVGFLNLMPVLL